MLKTLDFESTDKGKPLEVVAIPALTRLTLARFAGATDDYNPLHLDERVAVAAGKASVFAPSNLVMAYIGRMVEAAFAGASLRRFGLRMLKLVWPGDVLTCRGVVVDKRMEDDECVIDADVWADNQRGETVAKGRVLAVVPAGPGLALRLEEAEVGIVYRAAPIPLEREEPAATPQPARPRRAPRSTPRPARLRQSKGGQRAATKGLDASNAVDK